MAWLRFVTVTTSTATATPYCPAVGLEISATTELPRFSVKVELMFTAPVAFSTAVESTSTRAVLSMER